MSKRCSVVRFPSLSNPRTGAPGSPPSRRHSLLKELRSRTPARHGEGKGASAFPSFSAQPDPAPLYLAARAQSGMMLSAAEVAAKPQNLCLLSFRVYKVSSRLSTCPVH
ncbi:hypothetical protein BT69DRAFT_38394 [Atractiella rhizophila]|nr:hypothetical protein BT69DRAFT_38394 [Atractiella rhizophila]